MLLNRSLPPLVRRRDYHAVPQHRVFSEPSAADGRPAGRLASVGMVRTSVAAAFAMALCLATTPVALSDTDLARTTVKPIPDDIWENMQGKSWHADRPCPARADLVLLTVPYLGFDGKGKTGQLIVAKDHAADIAAAMDKIFAAGTFRIERMELVDAYGGDDDASMAANNTSAFNCRFVGGTTTLSAHAHGIAIDINPVQNPYVVGSKTYPPAGKDFDEPQERKSSVTGIILPKSHVTMAFDEIGWIWGGTWTSKKDYQHFSENGR